MGTNYTRIPTAEEMEAKRKRFEKTVKDLIMEPSLISQEFQITKEDSWEIESPWDEFLDGTNVHLGKRSSGWKFCWNFNDNKYYSNKKELIQFVLSGRVVDEYGEEIDSQEFLDMAFAWGEPDGMVADEEYFNTTKHHIWMSNPEAYYDKIIDGLRVSSSTEFS
jgi:hypothetical protein